MVEGHSCPRLKTHKWHSDCHDYRCIAILTYWQDCELLPEDLEKLVKSYKSVVQLELGEEFGGTWWNIRHSSIKWPVDDSIQLVCLAEWMNDMVGGVEHERVILVFNQVYTQIESLEA